MQKKRLLYITYEFPPAGGIGVRRAINFIKYLSLYNVETIVLTNGHNLGRLVDEDGLYSLNVKTIKIVRLGGKQLKKYNTFRNVFGKKYHPYYYYLGVKYVWFMDVFSSWFFEVKDELMKIVYEEDIDCCLTTGPPHSTHFFGRFLKQKTGLPWIMDIRDSFINDAERKKTPVNVIQNIFCKYYEKQFCDFADLIVTVSSPMIHNMAKRTGINIEKKSNVITNGFDPEFFNKSGHYENKKLVITYTGTFYQKITPKVFLNALDKLIKTKRINKDDLLLNFVGDFPSYINKWLNDFSHHVAINTPGQVSYQSALEYQKKADILLLILAPVEGRHAAEILTGKIFDYMGSRKTILGLVPKGPLKKLIENAQLGITASVNDVDDVAEKLEMLYNMWKGKRLVYNPNQEIVNRFTAKNLSKQLAAVVHSLCQK